MADVTEVPRVINAITDFLKAYSNPDDIKEGETLPIKVYMLSSYDVGSQFIFKWIISKSDMDEIEAWNNEFQSKNGVLSLSMGDEYNIELVAK